MKHTKIIFTALVASLALVAVSGATSAFASEVVLCKVNKDPCPAGEVEPAGSYLAGAALSSRPDTAFGISTANGYTYTCSGFLLGAETTAASGNPLSGRGEAYMYPESCRVLDSGGKQLASCAGSVSVPKARISNTFGFAMLSFVERSKFTFNCGGTVGTCNFGKKNLEFFYTHEGAENSGIAYLMTFKPLALEKEAESGSFCNEPALTFKGASDPFGWPPFVTHI